ncbi:MAG: polyphosphate kinase 1 [Elusimicrobia bacterium]|nr:polyphosphate kinase 1 [Elusimicrobiota bacterium]
MQPNPPFKRQFFNRNMSWLSFNDRVLGEAADRGVPLLERLRFAAIVSSNLNEFFMVRVAGAARLARKDPSRRSPDGLSAAQAIVQIREEVLRQKSRQAAVLEDIFNELRRAGITVLSRFDGGQATFDPEIREKLVKLKPVVRRSSDPLPELKSDQIHIFVSFPGEYAVISIEERGLRLLRLASPEGTAVFALAERWLCSKVHELFRDREVIEAFPFKIIREHDLRYSPDDEDPVEDYIEHQSRNKQRSRVVRLEVDAQYYSEGAMFLASALRLDSASLYRFDMPLDLRTMLSVCSLEGFDRLRYPAIVPAAPGPFRSVGRIMSTIKKHDIMLHHPYDSFDIVVNFLKEAAGDPQVSEIYHVAYRAGQRSPVMEVLKEAACKGKKVTVYVEVKARFDEENNLRWMKELRAAGAKVLPPFKGTKVHSKVTQVMRREGLETVVYTHLGTGNYHYGTARQYTDIGILTCDAEIGAEVYGYFNSLAAGRPLPRFRKLLVAPVNLSGSVLRLIRAEMEAHRRSGGGLIMAKMNSLVDPDVIRALYEASAAGVKVRLLVRGICCLKPGIKGLSENITVLSIVDRFLEHSRIFYFRAGGEEKLFLSSADWMPRNFYSRYEIAFPVTDPLLKRYVKEVILEGGLADNVKARQLQSDGTYDRVKPAEGEKPRRSQLLFASLAQSSYKGTLLEKRLQ